MPWSTFTERLLRGCARPGCPALMPVGSASPRMDGFGWISASQLSAGGSGYRTFVYDETGPESDRRLRISEPSADQICVKFVTNQLAQSFGEGSRRRC